MRVFQKQTQPAHRSHRRAWNVLAALAERLHKRNPHPLFKVLLLSLQQFFADKKSGPQRVEKD
jgi:hypothetical protein